MENRNEVHVAEGGMLPFDPIVLLQDVLKRWLIVVAAALVVGVAGYILTDMSYSPVYKTTTTFVVTTRGSSTTVYSNLSSTSSVAGVFTELLNSSILRKTIVQEMGVPSFNGTIATEVIPNTNLITMTVTASDPRTAFLAAQTIVENHEKLTYQVISGVALEVLQHPMVPSGPSYWADATGTMKRMAALAAAGTVALLAVLSFLRDTVRSGKEAREKLECDYLGELPHENKYRTLTSRLRRKKTSILITNPVTSFRFVEAVRKLRRRVEQHMEQGQVLMVTSLLENEGKSTVAVNLALSMAKKNRKVLLIDCDLRKPACHAVLDQKKFVSGIKEVLQSKANLSDSVLRYKKTNMYMLLARKGDRNVGDLLASERMDALLDWARENFDFVVLDLPPTGVASDAEGMVGLADACLLVIRQNVATAAHINRTAASLEGNRAKLLGCVLNNVYTTRLSSGQSGYGHYGKYGQYGKYGSYGSKK